MPNNENERVQEQPEKRRQDALQLGPRKKPRSTDPLVHHGRHFGRTIHALCNIHALINNGIIRMGERSEEPEDAFTAQEIKEHSIFLALLKSVPGLEERLMSAESEDEIHAFAALLQKVDWLTPPGEPLIPPIPRNVKTGRGFHHEITGGLLCPAGVDWSNQEIKEKLATGELTVAGDQWPVFLYASYKYDESDPWKGLLRSVLVVKAFKHIFTSPSSVDKEATATRSGNARIHGMTRVTTASIAYAATQARFALSSSSVFNRSDTVTDSERFYTSILELLDEPDEADEVDSLLSWWNR
ncbi:hypothetical protein HYPSUDRAFT_208140 [Hypholoma sublateritium FD-334 SS-4]|uniref:Uncharacterized protein n=1 Tax=Hypholoma sublateritium (strain FD-334 SS-4) TaxID=945553 RepID=A0A0D2NAX3_HYPSF|nr:hypothetical protein HYPSUDRAFT_209297 [Hypholoma sublateritium FD-334 SS-4]KJA15157.1 hypothetical protein HYPSUDRAFT_208140 [Hypholoma sublateritium FD-334 SS-4]